jgi:hypothetical protein
LSGNNKCYHNMELNWNCVVMSQQSLCTAVIASSVRWLAAARNKGKVKRKVKFTLEQATKAQSGSRGIALL